MGPNRMSLKSIDGVDHCSGFLLDRAATNEYEVFLDAMIDDETDEIDVDRWSPTAVSKMPTIWALEVLKDTNVLLVHEGVS